MEAITSSESYFGILKTERRNYVPVKLLRNFFKAEDDCSFCSKGRGRNPSKENVIAIVSISHYCRHSTMDTKKGD